METKPSKIKIEKFDELFQYIGGLGTYQIAHLFIMCLPAFLTADSIYINFIGYEMPHWCEIPELRNLSFDIQKTVAIPFDDDDSGEYSRCEYFDLNYANYTKEDFIHWNRSVMVPDGTATRECGSWVYDRSTFTENVLSRWNVVCDDFWLIGLLSTIFIAGHTAGSMVIGEIADRFGRRNALVIFTGIRLVGAILQVVAPSYELIAVARFLVGVGVLGTYIAAYVLSVEIVDPKHRVWYAVATPLWYNVGYIVVPGMAFAIRDYQKLLIPAACITVLMLSYYWLIPESTRWLVVQSKKKEAEKALRKVAAINGKVYPENLDLSPLYQNATSQINQKGIKDLLRNEQMRKWMLVIYFYWFSTSLIYFALSLNSGSLSGDVFVNTFLLGLVEIPANLINMFVLHKGILGRRTMSCISMAMAGIASFISIPLILDKSPVSETLSVVFAMLGKAGATMAFSDIYIFTSEIVPTEVRNTGMGTSSFCARISGMAAPYVGGLLADVWEPMPFLIYGIFGVLSGILIMIFMPETKGQKLSQTIEEALSTLGKKDTSMPDKEITEIDLSRDFDCINSEKRTYM